MNKDGWTFDDDGKLLIEFEEDEITLDLPVDDPVMDKKKNWMLVPITPLLVSSNYTYSKYTYRRCGNFRGIKIFHGLNFQEI